MSRRVQESKERMKNYLQVIRSAHIIQGHHLCLLDIYANLRHTSVST